jgi:hypothetical protein
LKCDSYVLLRQVLIKENHFIPDIPYGGSCELLLGFDNLVGPSQPCLIAIGVPNSLTNAGVELWIGAGESHLRFDIWVELDS